MIRFTKTGYDSNSTNNNHVYYTVEHYLSEEPVIRKDIEVYDKIDKIDIVKFLDYFRVPIKYDNETPRSLVSVLLDITRKYTKTRDLHISNVLIELAERINQIVIECAESGVEYSEITTDILIEPEIDDTRLDSFLQEFTVKGE